MTFIQRPAVWRIALLICGLLSATTWASETTFPSGPAGDSGYVGSDACADCHATEWRLWRRSHHFDAMHAATPETVLADLGQQPRLDGETFSFTDTGDGFRVTITDAEGGTQTFPLTHTFGIHPLQQYLVDIGKGRLQALPLAWDSRTAAEGGQRWFDIYPEAETRPGDPRHWTGIDQTWNYMCSECHSTALDKGYDAASDSYDTTWREVNVACEACHGPGGAHRDWAIVEPADRGPDPGFPATLNGARNWRFVPGSSIASSDGGPKHPGQVDACGRCHSRRGVLRDPYSHGSVLMDSHLPATLSQGLYHADGQIQDEVYVWGSFLQSRMYASGVVCSDCHDAHSGALRAEGNAVCARCHLAERFDSQRHHGHQLGSEGAACVSCHMPATVYMVVDPRRDHGFRVPDPARSMRIGAPDPCLRCHGDRDAEWASAAIAGFADASGAPRTAHFGDALAAGRRQSAEARELLAAVIADDRQPAIARATAIELVPQWLGPTEAALVEKQLSDSDPLVRRAAVTAFETAPADRSLRALLPLLDDPVTAVRLEAGRVLAPTVVQALPERDRSRILGVVREYIESLQINADRPEAHSAIGNVLLRMGRAEQAERAYRHAIELDPHFVPAYINLADLMRAQDRDIDGRALLGAALRREPGAAPLHHALGLLEVRRGKTESALVHLGRAVELEPENVHYGYILAVARHGSGNEDAALEALRGLYTRAPGNAPVLEALLAYSLQRSDYRDAYHYAAALSRLRPWDEQASARAQQLRDAL